MHGGLWDEIAPIAPLLIPLGEAAGALTVIALCTIVTAFIAALVYVLNKTVGRLPLIGGIVNVVESTLIDGFTRTLAGWNHAAQVRLGAAFHSLGRISDFVAHEIEQHSRLLHTIATLLIGRANTDLLWQLIHRLTHGQAQQQTWNRAQTRENHVRAKTTTRALHDAHVATKTAIAVPGHLTHEWDIPRLKTRTKTIEDKLTEAWKWIKSHPASLATGAFAGAVAIALTRLGLGWVRCEAAKGLFKKRGCGLWNGLDKLLGLFGEALVLTNICRVLPWLEQGFSLVAAPLIATLTTAGAGLCNPNDKPPELLPKPGLFLPASPDATLHLP